MQQLFQKLSQVSSVWPSLHRPFEMLLCIMHLILANQLSDRNYLLLYRKSHCGQVFNRQVRLRVYSEKNTNWFSYKYFTHNQFHVREGRQVHSTRCYIQSQSDSSSQEVKLTSWLRFSTCTCRTTVALFCFRKKEI